jgi:RNA polymerase sigma factor (sigma-70 family)
MAIRNLNVFLHRLTQGMVAEALVNRSDQQLVEQFLAQRNEAAFEAMVRRHGRLVYGVCWRVLRNDQDAEDAFQVSFLLLAEKMRSLRKPASLASWLHGIAHRVALKAKAQSGARECLERKLARPQAVLSEEATWKEHWRILDAALAELPEKWRLPLLLCYLEGRTQDEAARELNCSKRTLRRRLDEARAALVRRLARRGVVWSAPVSALLLSDSLAPAAPHTKLVASTVQAAASITAGQGVPAAIVSAKVVSLMKGVLKAMSLTKLKIPLISLLLVVTMGLAGVWISHHSVAGDELLSRDGVSLASGQKKSEQKKAARDKNQPELLYDLEVEVLQLIPNLKAAAAADPKDLKLADKSTKGLRLRITLGLGEPAKAQLGQVATVGAVKRDPLGLFLRARIREDKANKVSLELAVEDVGLVKGKADIKHLVDLKKTVPLGVLQEHAVKPKTNSGFTLKFLVKRMKLPSQTDNQRQDETERAAKEEKNVKGDNEAEQGKIARTPKVEYKQPFDLPSSEEVLNALPKGQPLPRNPRIKCELVSYRLGTPRFFPNVGQAQLSTAHFRCRVKSDYDNEVIVFIDKQQLIPCK